jgi:hypothetical protein
MFQSLTNRLTKLIVRNLPDRIVHLAIIRAWEHFSTQAGKADFQLVDDRIEEVLKEWDKRCD